MNLDHQGVAQPDGTGDVKARFDAALGAAPLPGELGDHPVADVGDDLAEADAHFRPIRREAFVLCDHGRLPDPRTLLGPALGCGGRDVRVEQLREASHVAGFEPPEGLEDDLYVLLRHRPRSIPRRGLSSSLAQAHACWLGWWPLRTMLQTIIPQVTAHPAAGMSAQAPAPTTTRRTVSAPKAPQSHMCEWFIASPSRI